MDQTISNSGSIHWFKMGRTNLRENLCNFLEFYQYYLIYLDHKGYGKIPDNFSIRYVRLRTYSYLCCKNVILIHWKNMNALKACWISRILSKEMNCVANTTIQSHLRFFLDNQILRKVLATSISFLMHFHNVMLEETKWKVILSALRDLCSYDSIN